MPELKFPDKKKVSDEETKENGILVRRPFIIIVVILLVVLLLMLANRCQRVETVNKAEIMQGVIELPKEFDAQKYVDEKVAEGMFQVFINSNIVVESPEKVPILMQNSEHNKYPVYVEIVDAVSGTVYYKSDVVNPGYKIEYASFDLPEKGKYDCLAHFHVLTPEGDSKNTITLKVVLTV